MNSVDAVSTTTKEMAQAIADALDRARHDSNLYTHVRYHMALHRRLRADTHTRTGRETWIAVAAEDEMVAALAEPRIPAQPAQTRDTPRLHNRPCYAHFVDTHVYHRSYDPFQVKIAMSELNRVDAVDFHNEIQRATGQAYNMEVWSIGPESFPTFFVAVKFCDGSGLCGRGQSKKWAMHDALCKL